MLMLKLNKIFHLRNMQYMNSFLVTYEKSFL